MFRARLLVSAVVAVAVSIVDPTAHAAGNAANWPAYLGSPQHRSFAAGETTITPANAGSLSPVWNWLPDRPTQTGQPGPHLFASPTVFRDTVYIGAETGAFYALDLATGAVKWQADVGWVPDLTCGKEGVTSTATVKGDATTGKAAVYVGGGDGYLYAFDAVTGSLLWRSFVVDTGASSGENSGYLWSSPTVTHGRVYIGMSSQCDQPLIPGGLKAFDQSTGALLATYWTMGDDVQIGGSIWSSAAVSGGSAVYVTTGNGAKDAPKGDSFSIVQLDAATLAKEQIWTLANPVGDIDFGGSPTLFTETVGGKKRSLVGACNKNGVYYTFITSNLGAGPIWTFDVGAPDMVGPGLCIAAAAFDGTRLFIAGNGTTIGGQSYRGSVRQIDPATGQPIWETGLPGTVLGSPSLDGAGVLAAVTDDPFVANACYLLDASTGSIVGTVPIPDAGAFSQPVFTNGYLLVAGIKGGLTAYHVSGR